MSKTVLTGLSQYPADGGPANLRRRLKLLALLTISLTICFSLPLFDLFRFAASSELYSYILLVPFISLCLVWLKRKTLPREFQPATRLSLVLALSGLIVVAVSWTTAPSDPNAGGQDRLALMSLAFWFLLASGCAFCLGGRTFRGLAFPLAFLLFMVPLPSLLESRVEAFLQHASANLAYILLKLSATPVLREDTLFRLPGISIDVAPECSGIHSTLVLFITGLLAGHLFLIGRWTKGALAAGVILLGIIRNAFRIFALAQLSIHVNPQFLDSELHHRGGPLFFVLSLAPLLALIWLLRKLDLRNLKQVSR